MEDVIEALGIGRVAIFVSGPVSMADEVWRLVSECGRSSGSRQVKLIG